MSAVSVSSGGSGGDQNRQTESWGANFHDSSRHAVQLDGHDNDNEFTITLFSHDRRVECVTEEHSVRSRFRTRLPIPLKRQGPWQATLARAVFCNAQSTEYTVKVYDDDDAVVHEEKLPRRLYETPFQLYEYVALKFRREDLYSTLERSDETIRSGLVFHVTSIMFQLGSLEACSLLPWPSASQTRQMPYLPELWHHLFDQFNQHLSITAALRIRDQRIQAVVDDGWRKYAVYETMDQESTAWLVAAFGADERMIGGQPVGTDPTVLFVDGDRLLFFNDADRRVEGVELSHPSADLDEYFWLMISKRLARVLNADEFARRNGNDVILCEVLFDSSLVVFFIRGDARRLSFPTQRENDVPELRYTSHGISTGYLDDPVLRSDRQSRRAGHGVQSRPQLWERE